MGALIAFGNYVFSKIILKKQPSKYAGMQIVRSIIQVLYLFFLYILGGYTPWERMYLLVGGCLGITLPMILFTYKLVKYNDSLKGKGGSSNG